MRPCRYLVRQDDARNRAVGDIAGIKDRTFAFPGIHVGNEGEEIAVIFSPRARPRSKRRLAEVATLWHPVSLVLASREIVFLESFKKPEALHRYRVVTVTVWSASVLGARHRELSDLLIQIFFLG